MCRSTLFFFSQAFVCASGTWKEWKWSRRSFEKRARERENFSDRNSGLRLEF